MKNIVSGDMRGIRDTQDGKETLREEENNMAFWQIQFYS
jgi:hypothetical protein